MTHNITQVFFLDTNFDQHKRLRVKCKNKITSHQMRDSGRKHGYKLWTKNLSTYKMKIKPKT